MEIVLPVIKVWKVVHAHQSQLAETQDNLRRQYKEDVFIENTLLPRFDTGRA